MKKLSKYKLNKVAKNLNKWFKLATNDEFLVGVEWYKTANNICKDIAEKYNTTELKAAGVISALSPQNKWEQNIKDAYTVFEAIKNNVQPTEIKVCTFHKNKFKAFGIAKGTVIINSDAKKTFAFVNNIAHLNDSLVTIDLWHLRACFNKTIGACGKLAYAQIQEVTLKQAKEVGLTGFEYQAVIWASIREKFTLYYKK
jgi:hypothetical protein